MRLHEISYEGGQLSYPMRHQTEPEWALRQYLSDARRIVEEAVKNAASACGRRATLGAKPSS